MTGARRRCGAPGRWARDAALVAAAAVRVLALPPLLYALLVYLRFGFISFSYSVPYEELLAAVRTGSPVEILRAPLVSANPTSGDLLASMLTLSVGQLLVSTALGVLMGLVLTARVPCAPPTSGCGGGGVRIEAGRIVDANYGSLAEPMRHSARLPVDPASRGVRRRGPQEPAAAFVRPMLWASPSRAGSRCGASPRRRPHLHAPVLTSQEAARKRRRRATAWTTW